MFVDSRKVMRAATLVVAVAVLACSSAQPTRRAAGADGGAEPCFNVANVDSFSALHPSYVLLRELDGKQYLLTLDSMYTGLPFATGIRIWGEYTWVCSGTGARIAFMDAGRRTLCRILRVEAVESREAAERIVKERTAPGRKE